MWPFSKRSEPDPETRSGTAGYPTSWPGAGNNYQSDLPWRGPGNVAELATVAAAVSILSRAFESTEISDGPEWARRALPPSWFGRAVQDMALHGQTLWLIDGPGAALRLLPCGPNPDVIGAPDPESWRYRVDQVGPTNTVHREASAAEVLHIVWSHDTYMPWRGIGPLARAARTADLATWVEQSLRREHTTRSIRFIRTPAGKLLGVEEQEGLERALHGTNAATYAYIGGLEAVKEHWRPAPAQETVLLREQLTRELAAVFGVPPELLPPGSNSGTAIREAYRRLYVSTLLPIARKVEHELQTKLDETIKLDMRSLRASDVQGSGRAFKSLVDAGMPVSQAGEVTGLSS